MSDLMEYHNPFDGKEWRITFEGVEVKDEGYPRTKGKPITMIELWEDFGEEITYAGRELDVPVDMIAAMIPIEAVRKENGRFDPKSIREEPGYKSDKKTPHRVSPGLMQTLISTAKQMANKYGLIEVDEVDRELLFDPHYSILLGGAYMAHQIDRYGCDPVLMCGAYNAGGVYETDRNEWRIRTYGKTRMDRYVAWYNDFHAALREDLIEIPDDLVLSTIGEKNVS